MRIFGMVWTACMGSMQAIQIQAVADHGEFPAQECCKLLFNTYRSLSGILFNFLFKRKAYFLKMLLLQSMHFGVNESQMALEFVLVMFTDKIQLGAVHINAKALRYV